MARGERREARGKRQEARGERQEARGNGDGFCERDLPPNPVIRFAHCRLRLCLRGRGNGDGSSEGLLERFFGFYGVIYLRKAIKTARETNHQKTMCSPFPCRKGDRGDRSCKKDRHRGLSLWVMAAGMRRTQRSGNDKAAVGMCGVIRAIRVIRLIRDSDTAGRSRWARTGG